MFNRWEKLNYSSVKLALTPSVMNLPDKLDSLASPTNQNVNCETKSHKQLCHAKGSEYIIIHVEWFNWWVRDQCQNTKLSFSMQHVRHLPTHVEIKLNIFESEDSWRIFWENPSFQTMDRTSHGNVVSSQRLLWEEVEVEESVWIGKLWVEFWHLLQQSRHRVPIHLLI